MRVIGRPHDAARIELRHHLWQRLLFYFAGRPNLTGTNVLARFFLEERRLEAIGLFEFLVHAVHHIRQPARARFEKHDPQFWEALENPLEDHIGKLDQDRKWVLQRMHLDELVEEVKT